MLMIPPLLPDILYRSTKESLNDKGVNISASGISVKTDKQMDREAYLDATQRYVILAIPSLAEFTYWLTIALAYLDLYL